MSLITIEGLDGVGKSTYMTMLDDYLKNNTKMLYHLVSFPRYNNASSTYAKMYLNGCLSANPMKSNPYVASVFFSIDRYLSYIEDWQKIYNKKDTLIICNRYVDSNIIYQGAKLNNDDLDKYTKWIINFEYKKLQLPTPDITLFLKMPFDFILSIINKRKEAQNYDIHETNHDYLFKCYNLANSIAKSKNWKIIYCYDKNGNIKSMNEIFSNIKQEVMKFIC